MRIKLMYLHIKKLFKYLNYVKNKYNTNIIIFYHPTGTLKSDGGIYFTHTKMLDVFKTEAKINDIIFVDMTNSFMKMFYESYHAAHGFTTGEIEVGHLNAHGHASVADSLYRTIIKLEEDDKLCQ